MAKKQPYKPHGGISSSEHYRWARKEHSVKLTSKPGVYKVKNETVIRNGLGKIPKKNETSQEVKDSAQIMMKYQKNEKKKEALKNNIRVGASSLAEAIKDATVSDRAKADKKKVRVALTNAYKNIKKR